MCEISNNDLLSKLEKVINKKTNELKAEIQTKQNILDTKTRELEEKCHNLEQRDITIECFNKRNNIVIFGIEANKNELIEVTTGKLNEIIDCHLTESDLKQIVHHLPRYPTQEKEATSKTPEVFEKVFENLEEARKPDGEDEKKMKIKRMKIRNQLVPTEIQALTPLQEHPSKSETW
ncbi:hypothetical protein JTB14_014252 [Gonioctena quinquepunctata]|nr:hypothetical protein JTB14_014252 [Gonioctena quinquepunctata]